MPSTYTSSLRLVLPATGELTNTWGTVFNAGATSLIDNAIAGTASITMTAANYTLSNNNGSADESRSMFLVLGGTPGGSYQVICPAVSKLYFVTNNTGHAQTVKTAAGTGISVPNGARMTLRCDGTNVIEALTYFGSLTLGTPLGVASGGTGAATFTANNVLLGNGTSAFQVVAPGTAGNVLTSNGTTWTSAAVAANVSSISFGTTGLTPSTATSGAVTVAGTLAVANGGTGVTTSTGSGAVVLSNSPALTTPNLGTPSAATLTNATGLPLSTGVTGTLPVANGGTGQGTYTDGQLLIGNTATTGLTKATLTAGSGVSITNGNGSIAISATGLGGTVTSVGGTGTVNGITLTGTVTSAGNLTLGGALTGVDLGTQVTGTLPVANGGTGGTTFAANNVLLGNGTGSFQVVAPGTNGNILTSNGTTWVSSPAPASGVTSVSFGTTGLTPSTATSGAVTVAGTLAIANGGTGQTTAANALNALGGVSTGKSIAMAMIFGF